jgi:hypothetical protein
MSTVFKAIDELRMTRGEDAALEFSSILSHYHLHGIDSSPLTAPLPKEETTP